MLSYTHSCMLRGRCVLLSLFACRKAAGRDNVPISPKQSVWYYLGERRWSLADVKNLWDSLGPVLVHSLPFSPAPETHAVTCPLGSTRCCTLVRS